MSPSISGTSQPSRFAGLPEYVSLSRTTTSSPAATIRLTKCEPMNPAPPVTSTFIVRKPSPPVAATARRRRVRSRIESSWPRRSRAGLDLAKALAEAVAPVGEARRVRALAAEHRVGRARGGAPQLDRRDRADAALDARLLEDRRGELEPRALPLRRDVPDPFRQLDETPHRRREMPDVRRAA